MSARGEVFLGDLVRALAELRPRDLETAARTAKLLGLDKGLPVNALREHGSPSAGRTGSVPHPRAAVVDASTRTAAPEPLAQTPRAVPVVVAPPRREARTTDEDEPAAPGPPPTARAVRLAERPVDFSLTALDGFQEDVGRRPVDQGPGDAELLGSRTATPQPSHEPPWKQDWARGVMFAAVSTLVESRELDQRTLLRKVARQEALRTVPRRQRFSTRRGAQLLLDHGAGMAPFQDDRTWLHELVGSIAGRDRVEALRFRGSPSRGVVRRDPLDREAYQPPLPGTPVILFSDLGLTRPPFAGRSIAGSEEWRLFIDAVVHSGCPLVCVTPYASAEYPAALRKMVAFIPFDRRISLRHAQEATAGVRRWLERL
ncbi:hypothetical protein AB0M39_28560 [Streptomyces sp. NPDC051907]|uniref:hypothetical protein n=1 Tax=Streptomyces sp. NPDC051907 TaxID=3155284 RepID=UPI003433D455